MAPISNHITTQDICLEHFEKFFLQTQLYVISILV
jgi:hypothetical protein